MINFFKKKSNKTLPVDVHSHLLPGIDDGVATVEEALLILQSLHELGYKKAITTPHINPEFFPNTPENILKVYNKIRDELERAQINIELQVAAEYYLTEELIQKININEPLLTFGDKFLLFECSFLNEPFYLKEFIFKAISSGYKPVLAHPERYAFVMNDFGILEDLKNRGVLFQINAISLAGAYQKGARKIAEKLIRMGMVDLVGSDCHNIHHLELLKAAKSGKSFQKALDLPLLNYQL